MTHSHTLRAATDEDYRWLLHFLPQLQTGDALPDEQQFLTQYRHRLWLFERGDGGPPSGCCIVDALDDTGYVRVVVIDAPQQGKSLGAALMRAIAAFLREKHCTKWCLNVKVANVPAIRLYERVGMRRAYESHALRVPWERAALLPSSSAEVSAREIAAHEDAGIEAAWELPKSQLSHWRAMAGQHLLGLFAANGECVGFARANPRHPGVFPFRVRDVGLARALIEAARPLFDTSQPLSVVVEDDLALAEFLLANGAERKMHLAHMRGDIPE